MRPRAPAAGGCDAAGDARRRARRARADRRAPVPAAAAGDAGERPGAAARGDLRARDDAAAAVAAALPAPAAAVVAPRPTPSVAVPASGAADAREAAVRRVISDYARALEQKDIELYRAVKGQLSADEEKVLRKSFSDVAVYQPGIAIESIEFDGDGASVRRRRARTPSTAASSRPGASC